MNSTQKRFVMFIFGCIIVRFSFVAIAKYINKKYLPYLGILALIQALGFIIIYIGNYRKTGPEVLGSKIWWNNLRPVHACLYILFALYAFKRSKYSWIPLFLDVVVGLFAFLFYHWNYSQNK